MRIHSLTRRIIVAVLLAELLCAACFSVIAILHEVHGRRRAFDIMLLGRADSLLGAVQDADDPEANVAVDRSELVLPPQDIYEVLSPNDRLLGASLNAAAQGLQTIASSSIEGYFNVEIHGVHYRALRKQGVRVIDRLENGGRRRPVSLIYASSTEHLRHEVLEAVRFYVVSSLVLLAATGLLLAWLLRLGLVPLRELAHSAARVSASSWEFAPTEKAMQTRELVPIISSIRHLLAGLREAFERQRRFTGDAAHELKTSLAVLKSSVQLLALGHRRTEEYEKGLVDLSVDVQRMEELIERMLALARVEEEPLKATEVLDLGEVLRPLTQRLRPFAELKDVTIRLVEQGPCLVSMHPSDAEILTSNLLMNAVQHSPAKTEVTLSVISRNGVAEIKVANRGDGIPEAALPHLFERFYRADASRSRESGGTGLGLAICKAIVERSRGSIGIENVCGQGTQIVVNLPASTSGGPTFSVV
jgi:signal transduction histidine kinase